MKFLRFTKSVVASAACLFFLAGGAANPVDCGNVSGCCMTEITDDPAFQPAPCGCGCGQFEESQVPDRSAVSPATLETRPVKTDHDYFIENENIIVENTDAYNSNVDNHLHSPPLILDNRYTPLLC